MSLEKIDKVKFGIAVIGLVIATHLIYKGMIILYFDYPITVLIPVLYVIYGIAIMFKIFKHADYILKEQKL